MWLSRPVSGASIPVALLQDTKKTPQINATTNTGAEINQDTVAERSRPKNSEWKSRQIYGPVKTGAAGPQSKPSHGTIKTIIAEQSKQLRNNQNKNCGTINHDNNCGTINQDNNCGTINQNNNYGTIKSTKTIIEESNLRVSTRRDLVE